jgi:hypothetical protein
MTVYGQASRAMTWDLGNGLEQREQFRFGLRALVKFKWIDGDGVLHQEEGVTRDISSKGMFICSEFQPPAKVDLRAEVLFSCMAGADTNLELRPRAVVLRVESATKSGSSGGFAVLNRSYNLNHHISTPDLEEDSRNAPN